MAKKMKNAQNGLSLEEARRRLARFGPNELPTAKQKTFVRLALEILREPMVFLLVLSGIIYFILGDPYEALSLIAFLALIVGITIYQEGKTERVIDSLRTLSSPRTLVIRDGIQARVSSKELVPGDLIVVSEGDRVSADGFVLKSAHCAVDESLLTGESVPVEKVVAAKMYRGTVVVRGMAHVEITETGNHSELGKIGRLAESTAQKLTFLQKEARRLVAILAVVALLLSILIFFGYLYTRGDALGALLVALTLAMAIIPNELPAVLLIFFAAGARRMAEHGVLARKLPAIENLGAATVICVDKTGTLTLNQMAIQSIWLQDRSFNLSEKVPHEDVLDLLRCGGLASRAESFDPMDQAFFKAVSNYDQNKLDWTLAKEYPLSDTLLAVGFAWKTGRSNEYVIAVKGAPEDVLRLSNVSQATKDTVNVEIARMGSLGLRVLAVAKATCNLLPQRIQDLRLEFQGLVGIADPVRPEVPGAIADCKRAGIRIIMLTGDHPDTAMSIANQIGLERPDDVLLGDDIVLLGDEELKCRLKTVSVFARMRPAHKLRLVQILTALGETVAMTGDGVNDVPALKSADIGIAAGTRGTDAAREASSLVLLRDDFSALVTTLRMGRRVFANLENAVSYLIAVHIPIAVISIVPVIFDLPLVLLPIHIAFLHLIIEPACTIVFEAEPDETGLMSRQPRSKKSSLLGKRIIQNGVIQGSISTVAIVSLFVILIDRQAPVLATRTMVFVTLILTNLALIATNRSWKKSAFYSIRHKNFAFLVILAIITTFLMVLLLVPSFQYVFKASALAVSEILICIGISLVALISFELRKIWV